MELLAAFLAGMTLGSFIGVLAGIRLARSVKAAAN